MRVDKLTYKLVFLLMIATIGFYSCKSSKKLTTNTKTIFEQSLLQEVSNGYLSCSTFSSRIKIDGSLLEGRSLRGAVRIKRDSIVWISVNLTTGIPVAKIEFTKDSVKVLDRIKDELYVGDYGLINKKYKINLNYNLIESILLNEFVVGNDMDSVIINRKIVDHDKMYAIKCTANKADENIFNVDYKVNKRNRKIEYANFKVNESGYNVQYSLFEEVDDKLFPGIISYIDNNSSDGLNIILELSKVTLNKRQKYPFKIPKKVTLIN
jgi:hypothetical protein